MDIARTPHGTRMIMRNGDVLTMNRDYPRPAFDVTSADGEYQGYLYPHNVEAEYGADREGDHPTY